MSFEQKSDKFEHDLDQIEKYINDQSETIQLLQLELEEVKEKYAAECKAHSTLQAQYQHLSERVNSIVAGLLQANQPAQNGHEQEQQNPYQDVQY